VTRLQRGRRPVPPDTLPAAAWPEGCLGYAVNVVRPVAGSRDLRATVLWTLMSRTLVFTTIELASAYQAMVRRLGSSCGDLVCLDGAKMRSNGIRCGDSFKVSDLTVASYRFASLPPAQVRGATGCMLRVLCALLQAMPLGAAARALSTRPSAGPTAAGAGVRGGGTGDAGGGAAGGRALRGR